MLPLSFFPPSNIQDNDRTCMKANEEKKLVRHEFKSGRRNVLFLGCQNVSGICARVFFILYREKAQNPLVQIMQILSFFCVMKY